jgi:hypothetical protein
MREVTGKELRMEHKAGQGSNTSADALDARPDPIARPGRAKRGGIAYV